MLLENTLYFYEGVGEHSFLGLIHVGFTLKPSFWYRMEKIMLWALKKRDKREEFGVSKVRYCTLFTSTLHDSPDPLRIHTDREN